MPQAGIENSPYFFDRVFARVPCATNGSLKTSISFPQVRDFILRIVDSTAESARCGFVLFIPSMSKSLRPSALPISRHSFLADSSSVIIKWRLSMVSLLDICVIEGLFIVILLIIA